MLEQSLKLMFLQLMAIGNTHRTAARMINLLILSLALGSCASMPSGPLPGIPPLTGQPEHEIPTVDLLAITPEMKSFIRQHAHNGKRENGKAWSLAYATMNPYLLNFDYDPQVTLPADEAFRQGQGNCLSFSAMFVAMARESGLRAYFQEVEIAPNWNNVEDNLLVSKHVNAVAYHRGHTFTVDVSRRISQEIEQTRRLSDTEAEAQYYNNLGADALIAGDTSLAYAYFRKGLETDPKRAYIWSNLGVALRRNGQLQDAQLAYRTALQLQPNQRVALTNLLVLYTEDGKLEEAAKLEARVERNQRKNPYYVQHLAELALEEKRYSDAIALAKKAIRMDADEYRFYYTLAQSQYQAGHLELAQTSLNKARTLVPNERALDTLTLPGDDY
ncbi:tetratricopeptide repeat protein [Pseudomonadota bacterium]